MRFAVLTKYFDPTEADPWLVDELVAALRHEGHHVTVLHYDVTGRSASYGEGQATAAGYVHKRMRRSGRTWMSKILAAIAHIGNLSALLWEVVTGRFDAVINFTMFALFFPVGSLVRTLRRTLYLGFVWDFYPVQQIESGIRSGGILTRLIFFLEHAEFRMLDHAFMMTEDNYDYMREYHRGVTQNHSITRLWRSFTDLQDRGSRHTLRTTDDQPRTAVFGGQMSEGRDLHLLIECAELLGQFDSPPHILVAGDGSGREEFVRTISERGFRTISWVGRLPVAEYRRLLLTADVGIVTLDARVSSPSFPSKTLDYMAAGLPIVASVQTTSSYAQFVSTTARCGLVCEPGNAASLALAILRACDDSCSGERMGDSGMKFLEQHLQPRTVAVEVARVVRRFGRSWS